MEFLCGTICSRQVSFHVLSLPLRKCGSRSAGTLCSQGPMNYDLFLQQKVAILPLLVTQKAELGTSLFLGINFADPLVSFTEQLHRPRLVLVDSGRAAFGTQGSAGRSRHGLPERAAACHSANPGHHYTQDEQSPRDG